MPSQYASTMEELFAGCSAVVLVTEWDEFLHLPYEELGERMKKELILDGRNVLNVQQLLAAGFVYVGIGR